MVEFEHDKLCQAAVELKEGHHHSKVNIRRQHLEVAEVRARTAAAAAAAAAAVWYVFPNLTLNVQAAVEFVNKEHAHVIWGCGFIHHIMPLIAASLTPTAAKVFHFKMDPSLTSK